MANFKLTELPTIPTINFDSTDLLYIVDVTTDTSNKITFAELAGNSLNTLTVDLTSLSADVGRNGTGLSGQIDTNSSNITILNNSVVSDRTNSAFLSTTIDTLSTTQLTLCAAFFEFEANTDIGALTTDFLQLKSTIQVLTGDTQDAVNIMDQLSADGGNNVGGNVPGGTNSLSGRITTNTTNIATNTTNIGTIANLDTSSSNLVGAVNELHGEIGTISTTANAAIPLATLKTQTAASTDFADFKSRIAAL